MDEEQLGANVAAVAAEAPLQEAAEVAPSAPLGSEPSPQEQLSRYPLYLLMLILAIDNADRYLLSALFPLVKEEFRLTDAQLGTLSAAFVIVATVGVVPFGILVDRYTRTRIVAWGTAVWSSAMIAAGLAPSYGALFGTRMFLGVAEASYGPASFSLLSDYYDVERRARIIGIYQVGAILGFLSLPIGGILGQTFGWRAAFHVYAIPGFVLALLAWRLREPQRGTTDVRHHKLETHSAGADSPYAAMPSLRAFTFVLRVPTIVVSLVSNGMETFFTSGLGIWTATFFVRFHGMSIAQASTALGLLALGAIIGALSAGWLSDLLLRRGVFAARIHVAAASKVLGVFLLVPAFLVDNTPLMLVLFTLGAITLTMSNPTLRAVQADVVHPDLRGRSASATSLVSALTAAASPLIFGLLSDSMGLRSAFVLLLPWMGIGGVILWVLGPRFLRPDMDRMRRQLAGEEAPPAGRRRR